MPVYTPKRIWDGRDAFILGGGPSLRNWDFQRLKPERVIGCNTAVRLGEDIVDVLTFGDLNWFRKNRKKIEKFQNLVVTNCEGAFREMPSLNFMDRRPAGLYRDALGWNGNTGAVAINIALLLGVRCIYLLGFDMHRTPAHSNWHDHIINPRAVRPSSYELFRNRMVRVVKDWKEYWPEVHIINVCSDSQLEGFPKVDFDLFWKLRPHHKAEVA